ncbi:hypothetical protein BDN70DRAFT_570496 [Pholiota conissans]|uniref:MYND-type domain-containing protein n=1 Tax=Pholiota conissans TaxID=109636 RepID=A0A9P6CSV8_9AGAR|nr:hypothetical protein BDN70DRAFT_570496 [Pholiota conissans]
MLKNSSTPQSECAACKKIAPPGVTLMRCSKCKISSYCSKECQKKHWCLHKLHCGKAEYSPPKLVSSLIAERSLRGFIQTAAVLAFGLDKRPPVVDRPLIAECHITIVPDINHIAGILAQMLSPSEIEGGTEGMVQVRSFDAVPEGSDLYTDSRYYNFWLKDIGEESRRLNVTAIVVDFRVNMSKQKISLTLPIPDVVVDLMRPGSDFQTMYGSLSVAGCLRGLNDNIKKDKRNQLMMRVFMSKENVDMYRRLAQISDEDLPMD